MSDEGANREDVTVGTELNPKPAVEKADTSCFMLQNSQKAQNFWK